MFGSLISAIKLCFRIIFTDPKASLSDMNYEEYNRTDEISEIGHRFPNRFFIYEKLVSEKSTVLDIGCGDGTLLKYLEEKKHIAGSGMDISKVGVDRARAKGINAQVCNITDSGFSLKEAYGYIILSEIIEHIPEPELIFKKIENSFHTSVLISIPNAAYLPYRIRLLMGKFPAQWTIHPSEHLRYWSIVDFKHWVKELGFYVEKYYVYDGFPLLWKIFPNLFGLSTVFVIKKVK